MPFYIHQDTTYFMIISFHLMPTDNTLFLKMILNILRVLHIFNSSSSLFEVAGQEPFSSGNSTVFFLLKSEKNFE